MARGARTILATLLVAGCGVGDEAAPAAVPPAASARTLEGRPFDPIDATAAATAPAVVLLFVSTHCPISNRYAPTIEHLARQWAQQEVVTWLVYPDPDDAAAEIRAHLTDYALTLPALRDPDHVLVRRAGARVTPEAAVFRPGESSPRYVGRIDDRVVEFGKIRATATHRELEAAVAATLEGQPAPSPAAPAIGCYISDLR
jgi:thiol-disulfide isomerase/thioredoxin